MSTMYPSLADRFNTDRRIPVGISSCLMGEPVRFNGGHKRSTFCFFFSSRRRHTSSVSAFLLNRSSDLAGGIASALAGGAMSKLFGGGQKAASGGIQGDVLATDNNTVGMGDAGIKSAIQGSNVPNPDEAVPSFVSGAMAKAGKGLLEG